MIVEFDAELWLWDARAADAWTFVDVPAEVSADIRELADGPRRGFGSLRVRARIGATEFATSIFPSKERGCFVLPVKKAVRRAEGVQAGDVARVRLDVLEV